MSSMSQLNSSTGSIATIWISGHQTLSRTCWPRYTCHKQQSTQEVPPVRTINSAYGGAEARPQPGLTEHFNTQGSTGLPKPPLHTREEEVLPSNSSRRLRKHSASTAPLSHVTLRVSLVPV